MAYIGFLSFLTSLVAMVKGRHQSLRSRTGKRATVLMAVGAAFMFVIPRYIPSYTPLISAPVTLRTVERDQTPSLLHMPAVDCKMQAERMLKAPAAARFAPFGEWEVRKDRQDDNRAYILAYVDAQNSFGALIRTRFICQAARTPDGKWVLADVAFEK